MTVRMRRRKQTLIEQRHRRLETYYKRAKILRESWPFPPSEKKVVIHLPSLGYPKRFFVKNVLSTSWNYRFNTFFYQISEFDSQQQIWNGVKCPKSLDWLILLMKIPT